MFVNKFAMRFPIVVYFVLMCNKDYQRVIIVDFKKQNIISRASLFKGHLSYSRGLLKNMFSGLSELHTSDEIF